MSGPEFARGDVVKMLMMCSYCDLSNPLMRGVVSDLGVMGVLVTLKEQPCRHHPRNNTYLRWPEDLSPVSAIDLLGELT